MTKEHYTIYTDGSAWPNDGTGVGAFAYVVKKNGAVITEQTGIEDPSTNNRMELTAAIEGLKYIALIGGAGSSVTVVSDSRYVVDGINSWVRNWKRSGWKGGKIKNLELWQELDSVMSKFSPVQAAWIKGHSGVPTNEQCDKMAEHARMNYSRESNALDEEFSEITSR